MRVKYLIYNLFKHETSVTMFFAAATVKTAQDFSEICGRSC